MKACRARRRKVSTFSEIGFPGDRMVSHFDTVFARRREMLRSVALKSLYINDLGPRPFWRVREGSNGTTVASDCPIGGEFER
jgi:hypothetical protein